MYEGWIIQVLKTDKKNSRVKLWVDIENPSYPKLQQEPVKATKFEPKVSEELLKAIRKVTTLVESPTSRSAFVGIDKNDISVVEISMPLSDIDLDSEDNIASRKNLAAEKLEIDELEALGLGKYAVHRKLITVDEKPNRRKRYFR